MSAERTKCGQRVVTCDGCGTPYAAVERGGNLVLVWPGSGACGNCCGTDFSRLELA